MNLKKVCPICAAVVLTWSALLVLLILGWNVNRTLIGILMGMSVGAIATKYDKGLVWKSTVVILGLPLVWFAVQQRWLYAGGLFGILILLTWFFSFKLNSKKGEQQNDRFKDCC